MRFLKNKIADANAAPEKTIKQETPSSILTVKVESQTKLEDHTQNTNITNFSPESSITNENKLVLQFTRPNPAKVSQEALHTVRNTKNIVKNYAQAIFKFALSSFSLDYLTRFSRQEGVRIDHFRNYVKSFKGKIEGIYDFRLALLITEADSKEKASFKRILAQIGAIFIKFYSVNWIFNSKVVHKKAHLMYRFKILRRITNPELFTYLKS